MSVDMNSIVGVPTLDNYYNSIPFNPIVLTVVVVIILLYFVLFSSLGKTVIGNNMGTDMDMGSNSNNQLKFLGIVISSIFMVLIMINGFNYFLNINIVTSIKNFFSSNPEVDILVDSDLTEEGTDIVPEIKMINQVYHIPDNKYTYEDAKAVCKAYGNRLATYKEIKSAHDNGADWCGYGWSDEQMALYPTQYAKWEKLQKTEGHEHDCGRPGINGGYIDNPNVKFGVNCYGYKPKITRQEAELMENAQLYPLTQEEVKFEKRVDYWKTKISDILVAPFNSKSWSRI
jgi:hypothetical protein